MLASWLIDHLMCGIYVGLPNGPAFYVITLGQHVIHRRTRVINVKSQLSRSLEPTTFSQFFLNLDCESICDPPGGDTLLAQGIYLIDSLH